MRKEMISQGPIERKIFMIRGQKVMLSHDLAELYGVKPKVLIQAVKRNVERFPTDFMFQLTDKETSSLRSQFVTSKKGRGGRRYAPYAFAAALALFAGSLAFAQAPDLLTYQGRLVESGKPADGIRKIHVKLCEGSAGECHDTGEQDIAVSNGLFRSTFTVPAGVDFSSATKNWHIEILVGGSLLSPREKLTTSPYAFYSSTASYANNLSAAPGSPGVFVSTSVFVINGRIGIGTADPKRKLEINDDIYINFTGGKLIMKSPDGTCSACGPDDADVWSCASIVCP